MIRTAKVSAPAKLNLYLDVLKKRADGYHSIETVMQAIDLYDYITVTIDTDDKSDGIEITCTNPDVPTGDDNICAKAVKEFYKYYGDQVYAVKIHIEKNIPMGAGMAGGSADAAGVIVAMNRILDTYLDSEELCNIGANVGADVTFCIVGRTQYATDRGDMLRQLSTFPSCHFAIGKGEAVISTAEAYSRIDDVENFEAEDIAAAFCSDDIEEIAANCRNLFEAVTDLEEIADIKRIIMESGALCACMTGSGSACFGIFRDGSAAEACAASLRGDGYYGVSARPAESGVMVISCE